MTENVQKTDLSACYAQADSEKRLFRHTQEPLCHLRRTLPVKRLGFLAMCLFVGFMCACKPAEEVANIPSVKKSEKPQVKSETPSAQEAEKPQLKSETPSVENVIFEPEQMENGPVPTDMKIIMTKEVNTVNVDGHAATGAGKNWSIKLARLKPEKKIRYPVTIGAERKVMGAESIGLIIGWTNKDGTAWNSMITVFVRGEKTSKKDGTSDEPRLVRISLISL